jgi:hypothetical protein
MPNNTVRIRTTPNGTDKYLKVKLEQDFDFIEVLSLKISQEDAYRNFCSDYGVVTGRVIINSGFGVPNARVSIFIPIDEFDANDPQIKGLYPYEIISDKDSDGIRYNLLPRTSETDNNCFTPVGTFPNKREVLDNPEMLEIYCKYYKFTTTTNYAGDFMIFGVPVGTYTLHVDADISDIGIASQRPYDSISQGTPLKFFESPTKFKGDTNLDKLIQVKSSNAGVNVQPFWGDVDTCEIGITRVDVDLNYVIKPAAIFMGSIFGDQDKNSVNKRCFPRRDMGTLCNQVANEGTIEMIRETLDGTIEKFDVEGGRVIDENGAWAYQIPMNLDYMVTDEFGDLVLSDDPNKGVPTRTSVRFKIGMDQTGNEGRLRTRAKYLVPHNPNNQNEIDYEFGEKTKKSSFRSLYWNKIYSVTNFISRFQQITPLNGGGSHTRNTMGIKDVDACAGDKTPFPFNRVATQTSPIFFIICLIIKIIGFLIYIMNVMLIPLINLVLRVVNILIEAWNSLMRPLCRASRRRILGVRIFGFLGFTCNLILDPIKYIPCVFVKCPADENPAVFAPGCKKGGLDGGASFDSLVDEGNEPTYYDGDNFGHGGFGDLCGLDDCIAFQMAQRLNMFQFDFYNDWINGSLYAFLLKYKVKRKKAEKFCEYDCDDYQNAPDSTTVDGNKNGIPDNDCRTSHLLDTCFRGNGKDQQYSNEDVALREGLIKKKNGEFFYAASTHNAGFKIFATDVVNLGAVFSCDWQGVPKVQEYLIPTSYKIAPANQEVAPDNATVLTTGQCDVDGNTVGVFFSINCLGLHVNTRQCMNLRHLCEFGVELDEYRGVGNETDGVIGLRDLDNDDADRPKWFRDVFLGLNSTVNSWNLTLPYTSDFNLANLGSYDFTSPVQNGQDYINFRNYSMGNSAVGDGSFGQPKHSYYFYFGILPGKTGLEVMNQRFFTPCFPKTDLEFVIQVFTTPATTTGSTNGSATFTFIGGDAPFTATTSGPNGYTNVTSVGQNNTQPTGTLSNLAVGVYTITGNDAFGSPVTQTFTITGPPPLSADAYVSNECTTAAAANGEITISSIIGGVGSVYTYTLYNSNGGVVSGPTNVTSVPYVVQGLPVDTGANTTFAPSFTGHGYTMKVTDGTETVYLVNLVVNGASPITLTPNVTQILCYGQNTGIINIGISGGTQPYSAHTTSTNGYVGSALNMNGLSAGTYTTEVVDAMGTHVFSTSVLSYMSPFMEIDKDQPQVLLKQCDPNNYHINLFVTSPYTAGSTVYLDYAVDQQQAANGSPLWQPTTANGYVNATTPLAITFPATAFQEEIIFRMTNAAKTCFSEEVNIGVDEIALPITALAINATGVDNTKQCVPNQVKFKFNVSHLVMGYTARAPYAVTYTVKGINSLGQITSGLQYDVITSNQQVITGTVPQPGGLPASSCVVSVSINDNVLCTSNTLTITVPLATNAISGQWSNTTYFNAVAGQNWIKKRLNASGGNGTLTGSPYAVYNGTTTTEFNFPLGTTLTSVITDSIGCTSSPING